MNLHLIRAAVAAAALMVLAGSAEGYEPAYEQMDGYGVGTLDERVAKLEKRLSGEAMLEILNRVEQLQGDVLRMRGEIEELNHALDVAKQQQKAMYDDLDQRLQGGAAQTGQPGAVPEGVGPASNAPESSTTSEAAPPPPVVPSPAPKPAPSVPTVDVQAGYQKGLNLLKDGKYPESVREFKSFLASNPSGENADNALYWMGEAYYVLRDFTASREAYRRLLRDFPQSGRAADAQLKLGYIEYDTGQWSKARELLTEVGKRYPGTNAATQAGKKLARMKQEGR